MIYFPMLKLFLHCCFVCMYIYSQYPLIRSINMEIMKRSDLILMMIPRALKGSPSQDSVWWDWLNIGLSPHWHNTRAPPSPPQFQHSRSLQTTTSVSCGLLSANHNDFSKYKFCQDQQQYKTFYNPLFLFSAQWLGEGVVTGWAGLWLCYLLFACWCFI